MKGFISVSVIPELSDCEYTRIFEEIENEENTYKQTD